MKKYSRALFYLTVVASAALINVNCSSIPPTRYYTLVANNVLTQDEINTRQGINDIGSIGIGPLVIPNGLENFSVISIENNNQIVISPYHLWAGNLKTNINQVLADNITSSLNNDSVWPYPWDNRNRPKTQVRIVFEKFIGERGKGITLQAKWTVLSDYGRKEIKTEKTIVKEPLTTLEYLDYVKTLNDALNQLSLIIADDLKRL